MSAAGAVLDLLVRTDGPGLLAGLVLKGTVLLLAGFLVDRALRRSSASARHAAWVLTLAALLALPLASSILPGLPLALLPSGPDPQAARAAAAAGDPESPARPGGDDHGTVVPGGNGSTGSLAGTARLLDSAGWPGLLLLVYAAGLVASAGYLALGLLQVSLMRRRAAPVDRDPVWNKAAGLPSARPVRLYLSPEVKVPFTWGMRRPSILLPAEAAQWPEERRREALIHELSHVRRLDWLTQIAARCVCALYWFHPLAWIALRRLLLEAERACDDQVLAAGAPSDEYARHLLELTARMRTSRFRLEGAVAMTRRRQLPLRIESILDEHLTRSAMTRNRKAVLTIGITLFALVIGSTRLVPALPSGGGSERSDFREYASGRERTVAPSEGMTPLMQAAAMGDTRRVAEILSKGASPDESLPGLGTPLILAATNGHLDVVRQLLDRGADANGWETASPRPGGLLRSPLGAAARSGRLEIVRLLLDRGAKVDAAPPHDATALIEAAGAGHYQVSELLLDRGADANLKVSGDGTPLIAAARSGVAEIVRMLLARGADPRRSSSGDGNPLIAAARQGDPELVELLLEAGAEPDAWVSGDESGFFHAVQSGSAESVRAMIEAGANVNARWDGDGTPLIVAARRGEPEIIDLLLAAGADPDRGIEGDGNPLIAAAEDGDIGLVNRLLAAGADADAAVEGDGSPLIQAARHGHEEVVRRLLDAGANVNLIVRGDENALINAAWQGNMEIVKLLVGRGADVNARVVTDEGEVRTAIRMARRNGHEDVVEYLMERGARD